MMKKSRYTEEQIIGLLKQHEAGGDLPPEISTNVTWSSLVN
jgi:hypothetical protein